MVERVSTPGPIRRLPNGDERARSIPTPGRAGALGVKTRQPQQTFEFGTATVVLAPGAVTAAVRTGCGGGGTNQVTVRSYSHLALRWRPYEPGHRTLAPLIESELNNCSEVFADTQMRLRVCQAPRDSTGEVMTTRWGRVRASEVWGMVLLGVALVSQVILSCTVEEEGTFNTSMFLGLGCDVLGVLVGISDQIIHLWLKHPI